MTPEDLHRYNAESHLQQCLPAAFQQLEVDYFVGPANHWHYKTDLSEVPILRMYGVTEHGEGPALQAPLVKQRCKPSVLLN